MINLNEKRLIKTFIDLVKIPSPSWQENKIVFYLESRLKELGLKAQKVKCNNSFNLFARIPGTLSKNESYLFSAHMDTVKPGSKINPIISSNKIKTDGKSILGADNKAAIAMILEMIFHLKEKKISHPPIELLFSCAEEIGLQGIKKFNLSRLKSKMAFVFDSEGPVGNIILKAPFHAVYRLIIEGKAAHAGLEPEKGKNAIHVLAKIIGSFPQGRINQETTINIGKISGGEATNIVAEKAEANFEIRSTDQAQLKIQEKRIEALIKKITSINKIKFKLKKKLEYPGYKLSKKEKIVKNSAKALGKLRIPPIFLNSGGGSDANIINQAPNIKAINLSCGMQNVHSSKEYILIKDLVLGTKLMLTLLDSSD